ncbi:MAG: LysM peptidoglycan-binding domain-containing protein, partial [Verrucomicrobiae bacterium]|nr:LysM peptidoglycan-binding domain-containing protein [Verrucomicrobiae bacterium]
MKQLCLLAALVVSFCGCDRAPSTITAETPTAPPPQPKPVKVTASASAEAEVIPAATNNPLNEALALMRAGQPLKARPILQSLVETNPPAAAIDALNEINTQLAFTPMPAPEKVDYTVQAGDTLGKLAKQFNTTIE